MINRILHNRIRRFESEFDYDMSYGHELLDISRKAFLRFSGLMGISRYREDVPAETYYAAQITAALSEDCGPCTQLCVTMAERAGVLPTVLRAVIEGDEQAMSEEAALGWRFACAVLAHDPEANHWRLQIQQRWGSKAVASLAMVIAGARVYPAMKYALGHGQACTRVRAGGVDVVPRNPVPLRSATA